MKRRILVTGCGGAASANFVDSLRGSGKDFFIAGTDTNKYHLRLATTDSRHLVPAASDPGYIRQLNAIISQEEVEMLHPQSDIEVRTLSENREDVCAKMLLPSKRTVRLCQDKMGLVRVLADNKVPVARSHEVRDAGDLDHAIDALRGSASQKVWLRATSGAGARASLPVMDKSHARAWIDYWSITFGIGYGKFMASEFLPGREFAFQSLWKDGRLITSQARERLEYLFGYLTPSGQTSSPSVARTVRNSDVNEIATKAVKSADANATGVFCVDLKENRDGVPCVTEINAGRFFTTSNFFAKAGCNMPLYYVQMALGERVQNMPQYDPLPADLYWIRMVDMGCKLVSRDEL